MKKSMVYAAIGIALLCAAVLSTSLITTHILAFGLPCILLFTGFLVAKKAGRAYNIEQGRDPEYKPVNRDRTKPRRIIAISYAMIAVVLIILAYLG